MQNDLDALTGSLKDAEKGIAGMDPKVLEDIKNAGYTYKKSNEILGVYVEVVRDAQGKPVKYNKDTKQLYDAVRYLSLSRKRDYLNDIMREEEKNEWYRKMFGIDPPPAVKPPPSPLSPLSPPGGGDGTAANLINAGPKTFNIYIGELGKIDEVNMISDGDEEEFRQKLVNTLLSALSTVSVQANQI